MSKELINQSINMIHSSLFSRPSRNASVDLCHGMLILSNVLSSKPEKILEIGIGPGFCSEILLSAIEYNQKGKLTCVDNFVDYGGNTPPSLVEKLKNNNIELIAPIEEKDFVYSAKDDSYDFLVSDGDHHKAGLWTDQIFRIMKPYSIMFFHDASNEGFPTIKNYQTEAERLNKPYYLFNKSSRKDEQCHFGLLMVINKK